MSPKQRTGGRRMFFACICLAMMGIFFAMSQWARAITSNASAHENEFQAQALQKFSSTLEAKAASIKSRVKALHAKANVKSGRPLSIPEVASGPASVRLTFHSSAWPAEKAVTLRLLPQYAAKSVEFLQEAASAGCQGELYRVEKTFLIQGRIACKPGVTHTKVDKGPCPLGVDIDASRQCPPHDPRCGCHGPIMSRGMVGWAGGSAGPDFFIYSGQQPATHWAHDHTVFAIVEDSDSWATIDSIGTLPVKNGGMTMLVTPLSVVVSA